MFSFSSIWSINFKIIGYVIDMLNNNPDFKDRVEYIEGIARELRRLKSNIEDEQNNMYDERYDDEYDSIGRERNIRQLKDRMESLKLRLNELFADMGLKRKLL